MFKLQAVGKGICLPLCNSKGPIDAVHLSRVNPSLQLLCQCWQTLMCLSVLPLPKPALPLISVCSPVASLASLPLSSLLSSGILDLRIAKERVSESKGEVLSSLDRLQMEETEPEISGWSLPQRDGRLHIHLVVSSSLGSGHREAAVGWDLTKLGIEGPLWYHSLLNSAKTRILCLGFFFPLAIIWSCYKYATSGDEKEAQDSYMLLFPSPTVLL